MGKEFQILVIDDEEDLRESLKFLLQTKGYEVQTAADGIQGLRMLENYIPDLIILDLNMPNMGGIEFYQKICDRDMPKYPVFVLTARANMEKFFKDFYVDGFMSKPFEIPDLIKEIGCVLEKNAGKLKKDSVKNGQKPRKVFIVENDETFSDRIGAALLTEGFTVNLSRTGAEAIERMANDVPEVACVKMNLSDIAGEIVIAKLKRMAKTADVKAILYANGVAERFVITDKIQHKSGVDKFVVVNSAQDLIDAINAL